MIKILYIVSTLKNTGPTNQLLGLVSNLPKDKYQIKILTLSPEPKESKWQSFVDIGVEMESLSMGHFSGYYMGISKVKKEVCNYKPDIIHSSGIRSDVLVSKLNMASKWCATIHNYFIEDYTTKYGRIRGEIMTRQHLQTMKKMLYPICCSLYLKKLYEHDLRKKMYAVQNGISLESYRFDKKRRESFREKNGIKNSQFVFVTVGSLIARKDPLTIIDAFNMLNSENVYLYVIGGGKLMSQCQIKANERTVFTGQIDNVVDYLLCADAFVSASLSEGLPYSVLEAGAMGLPMILSDIPQHREIWEDASEQVLFFQTKEVIKLKEKMEKIMTAQSSKIDRESISTSITRRFSSERMSRDYQMIYGEMLAR